MNLHPWGIGALLLAATLGRDALAQGSRADYERAAALERSSANRVFRQRVEPQWLPELNALWYRVETGPGTWEFVWVDAGAGTRRAAFDHAQLARLLGHAVETQVDERKLPITDLKWDEQGKRLTFQALRQQWQWHVGDEALQRTSTPPIGAEGLPPLTEFRRSRNSDQESSIEFENRLMESIEVFWIPAEGTPRSYGQVAPGEARRQHTFAGHVWRVSDLKGNVRALFQATDADAKAIVSAEVKPPRGAPRGEAGRRRREAASGPPGRSPDGRFEVRIQDDNLHIRERLAPEADGDEAAAFESLTTDGTPQDAYEGPIAWSPDGRFFAAWKTTRVEPRQVHLIESSPRDQLQPKLHTLDYPKPGDPWPQRRPRLFSAADRRVVPLDDRLVENSWSVQDARWFHDSSQFTVMFNARGHQRLALLSYDAATGVGKPLIEERSATFVDYAHKQFLHVIDSTREALWMSERDGWNHLYLYDLSTGQVKNQVTRGAWVVRGVEKVDDERRVAWLRVAGVDPQQDPYHVQLARVALDGSGFVVVTPGDGTHRWSFSPDGKYLVDSWSRVDQPPVTELRSAEDGRLVCEMERADASALLATGWKPPQRFVAKGRDGVTDIHGIVIRPSNFDPAKRWPVIENIYAGPQAAYVPKEWGLQSGMRQLAELGFVVVQIDGMGTSHRSKAFHDVCYKNLGDAGFPDRRLWLKSLAERHPEIDLSRVGIYGGSAGGQNAVRAMLAHGDFYKAAVADCGCHDNRMDKVWWNELWMGWPVGPHYAEQSNVTQAHHLQGKLLLVVGEMDRNVDPASTMQVVDALVRADKDFDLLIIPGGGHGAAESPYGRRRRMDFFVRHLLGVEPRHE
ncbi:MAG: prolyl oligopeptidase family serine peptidase [Pirellulales bacterium]